MNETANDVFNYLSHLKNIKKTLNNNYYVSCDEGIWTIFDKTNDLPVMSMTRKNFEIFQEIEV